jgi:hypothetical protein
MCPVWPTITFAGLTSRWMMPASCAAAIAAVTWMASSIV